MKRLLYATLALSLMGATAASARPWNRGHYAGHEPHYSYGYSHGWHGDRYYRGDGAAAVLGVGLGLFALAAITAQNNDRYYDYGPPPPPPPPVYRGYYGY
jgi:hypothetical protein